MPIPDSNHPAGQALTPALENCKNLWTLDKALKRQDISAKILHRLFICSVNANFIVNGDTF